METVPTQTRQTQTHYAEPDDVAQSFERIPPQDVDAEEALLGAMVLSTDAIGDAVEILGRPREGVFYRPANETVYAAIYRMWTDGQPVDGITLPDALLEAGDLERIGGRTYVSRLINSVPTAAMAGHYAGIVLERAKRRRLVEVCTRGVQAGYSGEGDTDGLIDATLAEVQALAMTEMETPKLSVADRWEGFLQELQMGEDPAAIDSPWRDLNDVVSVKPGQLITIGAGTAVGKSLMAFNWGTHVALKLDKPVLSFSMEMGAGEVLARITASEARVNLDKLTRRALTDDDWQKIARVSDRLSRAHNFVIDDGGSATLGHIRARARWMTSTGRPPGLIIVDYLQLMEAEAKVNNRAQEVAQISRGLKRIAMDLKVPVIALAQFNREAKDRRPQVTDFKESSSIEQDSNVILLLHIETDKEGEVVRPGEVDVIVAKNRQGPAGRVFPLARVTHYSLLATMAGS